jgi:hypothetical protein
MVPEFVIVAHVGKDAQIAVSWLATLSPDSPGTQPGFRKMLTNPLPEV